MLPVFDAFEKTLVFMLAFVNLAIFVWYVKSIPKRLFWLLPFSLVNLFYMINYPGKALLFIYPVVDPFSVRILFPFSADDLMLALLYSTIFFLLFNWIAIYLMKTYARGESDAQEMLLNKKESVGWFALLISSTIIFVFIVRFATFDYYGFGRDVNYGLFDILVTNLASLQYLAFLSCLISWSSTRCKRYLVVASMVAICIAVDSLFSTSKTSIVLLVVMYFVWKSYARQKIGRHVYVVGAVLVLSTFFYSYHARYYGAAFGDLTVQDVAKNFEVAPGEVDSRVQKIVSAMFNRIELLDNLVYVKTQGDLANRGYYQYGSLAEIFNLIPRILWPNRPALNFNEYLVEVVQQRGIKNVTASMGRIGESYFVFKWGGVVYSFFYALLFFIIYYFLFYRPGNWVYPLIYFQLYVAYSANDNYLMQGIMNTVLVCLFIFVLAGVTPKRIGLYPNAP